MKNKRHLSPLIKNLLSKRNISTDAEIENFLYSTEIYSASLFANIDSACERILSQIEKNNWIIIHGDFDVDGITATSILFHYIYYALNHKKIIPYIPDRVDEGYGITQISLENIEKILIEKDQDIFQNIEKKPLIISVDCGVKETSLIDDIWSEKFDFLITDHHNLKMNEYGEIETSQKAIIIHPQLSPNYPMHEICGCMVTFKLIVALNERQPIPKLLDIYTPFVALGTNCDIMPLVEENRSIVKIGLNNFAQKNITNGMKELMKISGLISESGDIKNMTSYHLGFTLGPRINAAGRLEKAIDAVRLFVTENTLLAEELATKLDLLNRTRQDITKNRLEEVKAQVQDQLDKKIIVVKGHQFEEGIVGLVAGKLCEEYYRPVIVLSIHENKVVGSCRSTKHLDISKLLNANAHHLVRFGGHKQAAGLTILESNIENFILSANDYCEENLDSKHLEKEKVYDMEVSLNDLSLSLAKDLELLEPFGFGNPMPVFLAKDIVIKDIIPFSDGKHARIYAEGYRDKAITCFNVANYDLICRHSYNLYLTIGVNTWQGQEKLDIFLRDVEIPQKLE